MNTRLFLGLAFSVVVAGVASSGCTAQVDGTDPTSSVTAGSSGAQAQTARPSHVEQQSAGGGDPQGGGGDGRGGGGGGGGERGAGGGGGGDRGYGGYDRGYGGYGGYGPYGGYGGYGGEGYGYNPYFGGYGQGQIPCAWNDVECLRAYGYGY